MSIFGYKLSGYTELHRHPVRVVMFIYGVWYERSKQKQSPAYR